MKRIYNRDNSGKYFQLEYELAEYSQGDKSIREYYFGFMNLWTELTNMTGANVPDDSLVAIHKGFNS